MKIMPIPGNDLIDATWNEWVDKPLFDDHISQLEGQMAIVRRNFQELTKRQIDSRNLANVSIQIRHLENSEQYAFLDTWPLTDGSVLFAKNEKIAQDNPNFFWDDTNDRLGIQTATPTAHVHVVGDAGVPLLLLNAGTTEHTDAAGVLDLNLTTQTNSVSGINVTTTTVGLVQHVIGIQSTAVNSGASDGILCATFRSVLTYSSGNLDNWAAYDVHNTGGGGFNTSNGIMLFRYVNAYNNSTDFLSPEYGLYLQQSNTNVGATDAFRAVYIQRGINTTSVTAALTNPFIELYMPLASSGGSATVSTASFIKAQMSCDVDTTTVSGKMFELILDGAIAAAGTLQGLHIDGNGVTTPAGTTLNGVAIDFSTIAVSAGTVQGLHIALPGTYGAATERAALFTGDGRTVYICTDDYALDITGDTFITGNLTVTGSFTWDSFTQGSVPFVDSAGAFAQDNANFFWDDANDRLGIQTASPSAHLDVVADAGVPAVELNATSHTQTAGVLDLNLTTSTASVSGINVSTLLNADVTGVKGITSSIDDQGTLSGTNHLAAFNAAVSPSDINFGGVLIGYRADLANAISNGPVIHLYNFDYTYTGFLAPKPTYGWYFRQIGNSTVGNVTDATIPIHVTRSITHGGASGIKTLSNPFVDLALTLTETSGGSIVSTATFLRSVLTVDAGSITASGDMWSLATSGAVVVSGTFRGAHLNLASMGVGAGTIEGMRIAMPAVYGAATERGLIITGDGGTLDLLTDTLVINATKTYTGVATHETGNATAAIQEDVDHTASTLIGFSGRASWQTAGTTRTLGTAIGVRGMIASSGAAIGDIITSAKCFAASYSHLEGTNGTLSLFGVDSLGSIISGSLATCVGLDLGTLIGTTRMSFRSTDATATMRHTGNVRIGSQVLPTTNLDVTGSILSNDNCAFGNGAGLDTRVGVVASHSEAETGSAFYAAVSADYIRHATQVTGSELYGGRFSMNLSSSVAAAEVATLYAESFYQHVTATTFTQVDAAGIRSKLAIIGGASGLMTITTLRHLDLTEFTNTGAALPSIGTYVGVDLPTVIPSGVTIAFSFRSSATNATMRNAGLVAFDSLAAADATKRVNAQGSITTVTGENSEGYFSIKSTSAVAETGTLIGLTGNSIWETAGTVKNLTKAIGVLGIVQNNMQGSLSAVTTGIGVASRLMATTFTITTGKFFSDDGADFTSGVTTLIHFDASDQSAAAPVTYISLRSLAATAQMRHVGDVMIGVNAAPSAKLHVEQPTLNSEVLRLESTATNDDPQDRYTQGRVATTNATVTTIETIAIPASTTVQIETRVRARRTGGAAGTAEDSWGYVHVSLWKNVAGTATQIGATTAVVTHESQAAFNVTHVASGGNVLIRVLGAASNNVTWHSTTVVRPVGT